MILGAGGGAQLLLPATKVERFQANLAAWESTGQPLASWTTYKTTASDTLTLVAKRAGISEEQLRDANQIPPRYRLASGSTILIPRDETMESDIPAASLDGQFSLVPEHANLRKVTYRVRRGDTVTSVAQRWKVLPKDVIVWNRLTSPSLFAGQRLELTVPSSSSAQPRREEDGADNGQTANDKQHRPRARAQASLLRSVRWGFWPASAC